jgi:hypothetical protein
VSPETGRTLRIIASEGQDWEQAGLPGEPWDHVSVSLPDQPTKCPAWPEMVYVKNLFWDPEETVIQLHPPQSKYINYLPGCLHLWRPLKTVLPLPPSITVGPETSKS